ncbi:MAG: hypothetical protein IPM59_08820 [Chloracidobacterium sp.]|nr:hypothetical protein [Chloracidobacterium sp.]
MTATVTDIMAVHDELDSIFLEHQRALLRMDHAMAVKELERYEVGLVRHMLDEERILLPLYSERCEFPGVAAPKLFLDEHEKMRAHITVLKDATADLTNAADVEPAVLRLLGHEAFYLRLSGHHDKREGEYLYPLLDAVLSDAERRELLDRVWLGSGQDNTANTLGDQK